MERRIVSVASTYHGNAATERAAAAEEPLPLRRLQLERSAERWEDMARAADELARQTAANTASRIAHPYPQSFRHSQRR
jgi:hypothetical protein